MRIRALTICLVLAFATLAFADSVAPSPDVVVHSVAVRKTASSSSAQVGSLQAGEPMELRRGSFLLGRGASAQKVRPPRAHKTLSIPASFTSRRQ
jgi:hypothetical protein